MNTNAKGISGTIDKFEVANLDIASDQPVSSGSTPTWILALAISASTLVMCFAGFAFYRCIIKKPKWCQPELKEQLQSEHETADGLPRAPTPSSEELEGVKVMPRGMIQAGPHTTTSGRMPPRPKKKAGNKRPPPRPMGRGAPPPPKPRGGRLDLGQTAEERRESWRI